MAFRDRVVFLHNDLKIPSIRINNLRMSDAGRYTCEYATYPSGNEQGTTTLIMLVCKRRLTGNLGKCVDVIRSERNLEDKITSRCFIAEVPAVSP
ncbi:hypothetical protein GOODEAATRI_005125 [Goodea atripinnis]|uniref:Immunoglobulin V-set domain-containing protein n=1 Tax=Goodea atripinnis TaxID=208336 RepID=A0ABV0MPG2_9TELE